MTPSVSTARPDQAECSATAPRGNVTHAGHKYVTNPWRFGEAEQR